MTPQMEANELLRIWQRNRDKPPHLRLVETKEDFARLHDETMAMFTMASVAERQSPINSEVVR